MDRLKEKIAIWWWVMELKWFRRNTISMLNIDTCSLNLGDNIRLDDSIASDGLYKVIAKDKNTGEVKLERYFPFEVWKMQFFGFLAKILVKIFNIE